MEVDGEVVEWVFPGSVGKFSLYGKSMGACTTGFHVKELAINLDAGAIVHTQRPEQVFVSHTHLDHVNRITHMVSRTKPPTFYVPLTTTTLVEKYLRTAQELTNNEEFKRDEDYQLNHIIVGVKGGEEISMKKGSQRYIIKTYDLCHSVPCIGYGFSLVKKKLKPIYAGLPGSEIGKLRKEGVEVSDIKFKKLFLFCTDSTVEPFLTTPELLEYPVVIVECTFLDDDNLTKTQTSSHMHWNSLKPVVQKNPNVTFVLIHFSMKYSKKYIKEYFAKEEVKNVFIFV